MYDTKEELYEMLDAVFSEDSVIINVGISIAKFRNFLDDKSISVEERLLFLQLLSKGFEDMEQTLSNTLIKDLPIAESEPTSEGKQFVFDLGTILLLAHAEVKRTIDQLQEAESKG